MQDADPGVRDGMRVRDADVGCKSGVQDPNAGAGRGCGSGMATRHVEQRGKKRGGQKHFPVWFLGVNWAFSPPLTSAFWGTGDPTGLLLAAAFVFQTAPISSVSPAQPILI